MNNLLDSEVTCPGDGNLDKVVNREDFVGVHRYWGRPSVFDVTNDGVTDQNDLNFVLQNFGHNCLDEVAGRRRSSAHGPAVVGQVALEYRACRVEAGTSSPLRSHSPSRGFSLF